MGICRDVPFLAWICAFNCDRQGEEEPKEEPIKEEPLEEPKEEELLEESKEEAELDLLSDARSRPRPAELGDSCESKVKPKRGPA
ncbi:hypothetical protein Tco_1055601 [Tanacetum coccineum]|uniref:Uncharacterized protein n=1 Tax=Tanacetum coccineum TaxID=301880 RepID=A0ABQ5H110_9ASTR